MSDPILTALAAAGCTAAEVRAAAKVLRVLPARASIKTGRGDLMAFVGDQTALAAALEKAAARMKEAVRDA